MDHIFFVRKKNTFAFFWQAVFSYKEMFQEDLTEKLYHEFQEENNYPVDKITTRGTHQGVTIVCEKDL